MFVKGPWISLFPELLFFFPNLAILQSLHWTLNVFAQLVLGARNCR